MKARLAIQNRIELPCKSIANRYKLRTIRSLEECGFKNYTTGNPHHHTAYHKPLQSQNVFRLVSTNHTRFQGATYTLAPERKHSSSDAPAKSNIKLPYPKRAAPPAFFEVSHHKQYSQTIPVPRACFWSPFLLLPSHMVIKRSQPLSVSGMDDTRLPIRNTRQHHRIVYSCWNSQTVTLTRMAGCFQRTNIPRSHEHGDHARALSVSSPINHYPHFTYLIYPYTCLFVLHGPRALLHKPTTPHGTSAPPTKRGTAPSLFQMFPQAHNLNPPSTIASMASIPTPINTDASKQAAWPRVTLHCRHWARTTTVAHRPEATT